MVRFADQPRVHGPQAQLGSLGIADQEQKEVQDGRESEVEGTTEEGAGESVEDEEEVSRGNCETLFNNAWNENMPQKSAVAPTHESKPGNSTKSLA